MTTMSWGKKLRQSCQVTNATTHLAACAGALIALPAAGATGGGAPRSAAEANTPGAAAAPAPSSKRNSEMSNWSASGGGGGAAAAASAAEKLEVELPPWEKYEDMEAASPAGAGWWYSTGRAPTAAMTGRTTAAGASYL